MTVAIKICIMHPHHRWELCFSSRQHQPWRWILQAFQITALPSMNMGKVRWYHQVGYTFAISHSYDFLWYTMLYRAKWDISQLYADIQLPHLLKYHTFITFGITLVLYMHTHTYYCFSNQLKLESLISLFSSCLFIVLSWTSHFSCSCYNDWTFVLSKRFYPCCSSRYQQQLPSLLQDHAHYCCLHQLYSSSSSWIKRMSNNLHGSNVAYSNKPERFPVTRMMGFMYKVSILRKCDIHLTSSSICICIIQNTFQSHT